MLELILGIITGIAQEEQTLNRRAFRPKLTFIAWSGALAFVLLGTPAHGEGWRDKIKHAAEKVHDVGQKIHNAEMTIKNEVNDARLKKNNEILEAQQAAAVLARSGNFAEAHQKLEDAISGLTIASDEGIRRVAYQDLQSYFTKDAEVQRKLHPSILPAETLESLISICRWAFYISWAPIFLALLADLISTFDPSSNTLGTTDGATSPLISWMSSHKIGLSILLFGVICLCAALLLERWYEPQRQIKILESKANEYKQKAIGR